MHYLVLLFLFAVMVCICSSSNSTTTKYPNYFTNYRTRNCATTLPRCIETQQQNGWIQSNNSTLPLVVFLVGIEGSGHHLFRKILEKPLFDCVWEMGPHYEKTSTGMVPHLPQRLHHTLKNEIAKGRCGSVLDALDSFPAASAQLPGRVMSRPDILALSHLDGRLFNLKVILLARNVAVRMPLYL